MPEPLDCLERRLEVKDGAGDLSSVPKERKVGVRALINEDVVVDRGARPVIDVNADRVEGEVALTRLCLIAAGLCRCCASLFEPR